MTRNHIIDKYLYNYLTRRLHYLGLPVAGINKVIVSIEKQMVSLISHWNDREFRDTILFLALEEAEFYEPAGPIEVRAFVVTTIRNSMLELIACDDCSQVGLSEPILNNAMKELTKEAILYFYKVNLSDIAKEFEINRIEDVYSEIASKYPVAWTVIKTLALNIGQNKTFEKIIPITPIDYDELKLRYEHSKEIRSTVFNGISEELDINLLEVIGETLAGITDFFYIDCFKMLTRNLNKLLRVFEILLEKDKIIVTANYYISNGHVEKRKRILRAAHDEKDMLYNMQCIRGTAPKHREVLLGILNSQQ